MCTYNQQMAFIPVLEIAAKTDTGLVRAQNEDAIAFSTEHGYAILADGMGGYRAGEVASRMAVEVVGAAFDDEISRLKTQPLQSRLGCAKRVCELMVEAIHAANTEIVKASQADPEWEGMGTTLVVAVAHDDVLTVAHVGDSRAYRLRNDILERITRDHSLLQEQIDAGLITVDDARLSLNKNLVTRALGVDTVQLDVEIHEHHVLPGDMYLLCSDGLSDMLDDAEIRDILASSDVSLDAACNVLVSRANSNGGHDNISVVLVRVVSRAAEPRSLFRKMLGWLG